MKFNYYPLEKWKEVKSPYSNTKRFLVGEMEILEKTKKIYVYINNDLYKKLFITKEYRIGTDRNKLFVEDKNNNIVRWF